MTSEFECGTRFQESQELQRSLDCDALGFDEFQGGTRCGGDEGGVTRFGTSQYLLVMSCECYGM